MANAADTAAGQSIVGQTITAVEVEGNPMVSHGIRITLSNGRELIIYSDGALDADHWLDIREEAA
jgi:hypothetical protein